MANAVTVQTLVDGPRNLTVKIVGILDTSDLAYTVEIDPTAGAYPSTAAKVWDIQFAIEDALAVNMYWDDTGGAGAAALIDTLTGRGTLDASRFGGLVNNTASPTGKIALSTQGWSAGAILSFNLTVHLVK